MQLAAMVFFGAGLVLAMTALLGLAAWLEGGPMVDDHIYNMRSQQFAALCEEAGWPVLGFCDVCDDARPKAQLKLIEGKKVCGRCREEIER